jgi:hypothetical protein
MMRATPVGASPGTTPESNANRRFLPLREVATSAFSEGLRY